MNDTQLNELADLIAEKIKPKLCYSAEEAAEQLACSVKYISKLRRAKRIKGIKKGNSYIYPAKELEKYVENYGIKKGA